MDKMEKSTAPNVPNLNEDALACQVLEIIGGITLRALQNLEGPEDRDAWSMEEGDDSVFYSDDDAAHQDMRDNKACEFINEHRRLVNSEADETPAPQWEDDLGGGDEIEEKDADTEVEKETTHQDFVNDRDEEHKTLQINVAEPVDHLETANPDAEIEETVETCELNNTPADMEPEHNKPAEKVEVKESEAQTANAERFDVTNEEKFTEDATTPKQMSSAKLHISDDKQLEVDWQPEQGCSSHVPRGLNQDSGPGCSTLPPHKKPSHQTSFNHLDSSKYSTMSYRKIRRGNTRQKIEVFEYMMMNL